MGIGRVSPRSGGAGKQTGRRALLGLGESAASLCLWQPEEGLRLWEQEDLRSGVGREGGRERLRPVDRLQPNAKPDRVGPGDKSLGQMKGKLRCLDPTEGSRADDRNSTLHSNNGRGEGSGAWRGGEGKLKRGSGGSRIS